MSRDNQIKKVEDILDRWIVNKWIKPDIKEQVITHITTLPKHKAHTYIFKEWFGENHLYIGRAKEEKVKLKYIVR